MNAYPNFSPRPRRIATLLACVAVLGVPTWKIAARAAAPEDRPSARPTPDVERDATSNRVVQAHGSIFALTAEIKPQVNGVVREINCAEGQRVQRGQVLVQLDDRRERLQLAAAEAKLRLAMASLERIQAARERGTAPTTELEEARVNVEIEKITVDFQRLQLEERRLMAPIDGVVAECTAHVGQVVTDGARLALLIELSVPKVHFLVSEADAARIKPGAKVEVMVHALPKKTFAGAVYFVSPQSTQGKVEAKANLADTADSGLKPGMAAVVKLTPAD